METSQAQAIAQEIKKYAPIGLEAGEYIARQLKKITVEQGKTALRLIRKWGLERRRFDRLIEYFTDPWAIEIADFPASAHLIPEYLYRCAEIHEDGEWQPIEMCLRRSRAEQPSVQLER